MANIEFEIEDFTPAPASNEFDGMVKALIDAGEGKATVIKNVPAADVSKIVRRFGEAANRADKSPRVRSKTENEDGTVNIRVTVGPRIIQDRSKSAEAKDAAATEDVPVAEDSSVADETPAADEGETPAPKRRR